jgi:hypothetical protein
MGLIARASGMLEVLAPQPFSISLVPTNRSVRQNDAVQTVSYRVLFDRAGGFAGPVYLELVGFVGRETFAANPIPAGVAETTLSFDTAEMPIGVVNFDVVAYEDPADMPPA